MAAELGRKLACVNTPSTCARSGRRVVEADLVAPHAQPPGLDRLAAAVVAGDRREGRKVPEKAGPAAMVTVPFSAPVWLVHAGRVKSAESRPSSLSASSAFLALFAVPALVAVAAPPAAR
jgi:hypothetical protein